MSPGRLEDVFKTPCEMSLRRLQDAFKTYLQDAFETSWKSKNCNAEDLLKTPLRRAEDQQMFAGNYSLKFKEKITGQAGTNDTRNVKTMVPFKYLSNFWRALEILLIDYEINANLISQLWYII